MYGKQTAVTAQQAYESSRRNGGAGSVLTQEQFTKAFNTGRSSKDARIQNSAARQRGEGKVYFGQDVDYRGERYKAASEDMVSGAELDVIKTLAKITGTDVVFYQSEADMSGRYKGANGFMRNGTMYLDVNAGANRTSEESAVLLTAAHELTHYIRENNAEGYAQLCDFVTRHLIEDGADIEALAEQKAARENGLLSMDEAVEEVIADSCEMMLEDTQLPEIMAKENPGLYEQIREWIANFAEKLRKVFTGVEARHAEAKAMMKYADELSRIWDSALAGAVKNTEAASGTETGSGNARWSKRENTALSEEDREEYMQVGNRQHVRDLKNNMLRRGDSPVLYTKSEIKAFIQESLNGENPNTIKAYGRVGTRMADDIAAKANSPIDVAGYYLELDSNRIEHMKDHVDDDSDRRNIPLSLKQIQELPQYIDTYDEVLDVLTRKDGSTRVYLGKESENGNIVILELVSKGRQSMQPVTAWQNTKENYQLIWGQKKKAANTSRASQSNAESGYKATIDNTIPQPGGKSNAKFSMFAQKK